MTIDESDISDDSFRGLMKNLNLDSSQFENYQTNYDELSFGKLSQIKQIIESQLSLLFDILKQKYNADMDTRLLTSDGFPRSDIDVVSIRLIRVKIIRLRNDHKDLLKVLNDRLIEQFQSVRESSNETTNTTVQQQSASDTSSSSISYSVPFARVSEIAPNGPASTAGLQEGDKIVLFDGNIHAANHNKLANVVSSVKNGISKSIPVQILRDHESLVLNLKPTHNWGGQGLLGCRLIPL